MTEKVNESLSALMDNESDELEFQRILSDSDDEALRQTWRRYHITRSVIREGDIHAKFASIDISRQVSAALSGESSHKPAWNLQQYLKPVASFAVAASVATVVIMSGQWLNDQSVQTSGPSVAAETAIAVNAPGPVAAAGVRTVNFDRASNRSLKTDRSAVYNNFARQRLQRFMLHNAEHAALNSTQGMMTFARVSSSEVK